MTEYFHEWKAKTMVRLSDILQNVDDKNLRKYIDYLIRKLAELRSRDISSWVKDLVIIANNYPSVSQELFKLVPTEEQIEFWFKKSE